MRPHSIKRKLFIAVILVAIVAGLAVWFVLPRLNEWVVGFHQKDVTRSLARWTAETTNITNLASAIHAAEMIGYMSSYYVPGDGYRGPRKVEEELEQQRSRSVALLASALEQYTGLNFGTNADLWSDWAKQQTSNIFQPGQTE